MVEYFSDTLLMLLICFRKGNSWVRTAEDLTAWCEREIRQSQEERGRDREKEAEVEVEGEKRWG